MSASQRLTPGSATAQCEGGPSSMGGSPLSPTHRATARAMRSVGHQVSMNRLPRADRPSTHHPRCRPRRTITRRPLTASFCSDIRRRPASRDGAGGRIGWIVNTRIRGPVERVRLRTRAHGRDRCDASRPPGPRRSSWCPTPIATTARRPSTAASRGAAGNRDGGERPVVGMVVRPEERARGILRAAAQSCLSASRRYR